YEAGRKPGPITEAACWAHGRRKFFVLADITAKVRGKLSVVAPLALAAIKRIDAIFDIEREISGLSADELSAAVRSRRWLQTSKPGCGPNAPNSLAILRWPRRWTTCSSAGPPLHASSTTGGFASPTMPLRENCAASRSVASHGCSPVPTAAANAPPWIRRR